MAAKKTVRKAPKKAVKKAVKKVAKRSTAKKSTARKAVKKTAKRKSGKKSATYKVPPVPLSGSARSSVSTISTTPKPAGSSYSSNKSGKSASNSSNRVLIAVVLGIIILAIAVVASGTSDDESTTVTPAPIASESAAPMPSETASQTTAAPLSAHEAPTKIVAQYTTAGATVFWKSPETAIEGITGYNLELRAGGSTEWSLVATLPATQFSQDITKAGTNSWAQVKVSTVYSDGVIVDGKIFGLPGSWK